MFSNAADWVSGYALGAQVFSTQPVTFDGSLEPTARGGQQPRETVDPDDFGSGFATWSGTSFAAPAVAGRYLQALLDLRADGADPEDLGDPAAARKSALESLSQAPGS